MGINPEPVFTSILERVKELVDYPVYVAEIPETASVAVDDKGRLKPFVVLSFGGPYMSFPDRGIVSVRNDTTVLLATVDCYAGRAVDAMKIKGYILDGLAGWSPEGGSPLVPKGSMVFSRSSNTVRPTQYIEAFSLECYGNLSNESVI